MSREQALGEFVRGQLRPLIAADELSRHIRIFNWETVPPTAVFRKLVREEATPFIGLAVDLVRRFCPGTDQRHVHGYRQDLPYGSPAWHNTYATLRNTIEGLNGLVKDPAHEALAQPARRRVRGIAAQSIFTALLLMAASIRKIRAWRALTDRGKARITRRARRRRSSLPDYLPDG